MKVDRRELLLSGAAAGIGMALAGRSEAAQTPKPKATLNISSQDGVIPGASLPEKLEKMEKWGFDGFEVHGGNLPARVPEIQAAMKNSKLKISAICAGYDKCLLSDSEADRRRAIDTMKEILTAAGALGSTGLIIVPAFNGQSNIPFWEARTMLLDLLKEVGTHAASCNTRVLLEPLNRGEAHFMRQLADAASICRDVNNPGVCMMGDFYHMNIEEPSDMGAFISAGKYLHHVHLASRKRVLPGQDERTFVDGFRGLKAIGYQDFCSLECGCDGDRETEIPKAVKFLRSQWKEA